MERRGRERGEGEGSGGERGKEGKRIKNNNRTPGSARPREGPLRLPLSAVCLRWPLMTEKGCCLCTIGDNFTGPSPCKNDMILRRKRNCGRLSFPHTHHLIDEVDNKEQLCYFQTKNIATPVTLHSMFMSVIIVKGIVQS